MRISKFLAVGLVVIAACSSSSTPTDIEDLPPTSPEHMQQLLGASDQPVVLNIWASWCVPCRSEAPLLNAAHDEFGEDVLFIGVDVGDTQGNAKEFLAEFGISFDNYFDPNASIRADLGGVGVPVTYFISAGGGSVNRHNGVIDERTLVLGISDLLAGE